MKLSSKELKRQARANLSGRYGLPMGAFVITELIVMVANFPFNLSLQKSPTDFQITISSLAGMIISLLSIILSCGLTYIHLCYARGKETSISDLFRYFTRRPDRFILASLLLLGIMLLLAVPATICTVVAVMNPAVLWICITVVLWIVSFVVMFILSYSYGLIYYLLIDRPDDRIVAIFRESRRLMQGNKGRMFYISLSFLGMLLLGILSFGIGLLWVVPYMNQTTVEFYRNVIGELVPEQQI